MTLAEQVIQTAILSSKAAVPAAKKLTEQEQIIEDLKKDLGRIVPSEFTGDIAEYHRRRHECLERERNNVMAFQGVHAHHNPGGFIDVLDEVNMRIAACARDTGLDMDLFKSIMGGAKNYLTEEAVMLLTMEEHLVIFMAHRAVWRKYNQRYGVHTYVG